MPVLLPVAELTILTAARTNEAINTKPEEIDLNSATWTIPGQRMKAKKEHRVRYLHGQSNVREMLSLKADYLLRFQRWEGAQQHGHAQLLDRMNVNDGSRLSVVFP
jgi:integrase